MPGDKKISELDAMGTVGLDDQFPIIQTITGPFRTRAAQFLGDLPKSTATRVVAANDSVNAESRADLLCNGIDDHVTIQAAIDALPEAGGRVFLLEGNFECGGQILVPHDVSLIGSGKATWVNFDVVQDEGITNKNATDWRITIAHMRIDGFNKTNDPIEFSDCLRCNFLHLEILRGNHDGIELSLCDDCLIHDVIAHDSATFHGIEIDDGSQNCIVSDCIVYNCPASGIVVDGTSHHNLITGCISRDNTGYGIQLNALATDNVVVGNLIEGNTIGNVLDNGARNSIITYENGRIGFGGFGAESILGKAHVFTGDAGAVVPNSGGDEHVVESDGDAGYSILTPADKNGNFYFASPSSNIRGGIRYTHSLDELSFRILQVIRVWMTETEFRTDLPIKIKEAAAAVASTAGYGQLWVKNAAPAELWFTDDTGTDTQIV